MQLMKSVFYKFYFFNKICFFLANISTLHNLETMSVPNVETTLIQSCFNLVSRLVQAKLNPIELVMIMDLQID